MDGLADFRQVKIGEVGYTMPQNDLRLSAGQLTELQVKCLEGFWNRQSAKQIALDLGISEAWVNKNLMAVRRTLHVNSSAEAAAIMFGGKRDSIKTYYYQESGLSRKGIGADQAVAGASGSSFALAASERPLINTYGALTTIAGVIVVSLISIACVALTIEAGEGLYQLLGAFGY